jgi:haloacetate dehalogenase
VANFDRRSLGDARDEAVGMFEGFERRRISTGDAEIHTLVGGSGPPLLCLHGFPQTHVTWRKVAPALAEHFTVVLTDLRGYGDSSFPESDATHAAYSKRAMAGDVAKVMTTLGFERFAVAGHDRGGRVGYRLALDAPERVSKLAVLDIVPTLDTYGPMTWRGSYRSYHWYFLVQPEPMPETLIGANPDYYLDWTTRSWTALDGTIEEAAMDEYRRWFRKPGAVHAACEDYRAGYTRDMENDQRDRDAGKRIACPLLTLWGGGPTLQKPISFLDVWKTWADDVRGGPLECGHFLPEELPKETTAALLEFFTSV